MFYLIIVQIPPHEAGWPQPSSSSSICICGESWPGGQGAQMSTAGTMVQSDFLHQQTKQRFVQRIAQHPISIIHSRNWTGRECPLDSDWIFQAASRSWGQFNGHVKDKMKTDLTALTPEVIFHWYLHWLQSLDWKYFFCQYKWRGCGRHQARAAPPSAPQSI